jgi:hypothetical protein
MNSERNIPISLAVKDRPLIAWPRLWGAGEKLSVKLHYGKFAFGPGGKRILKPISITFTKLVGSG